MKQKYKLEVFITGEKAQLNWCDELDKWVVIDLVTKEFKLIKKRTIAYNYFNKLEKAKFYS